jgi:phospholipid/cholesterol/gamma-HCH transport system permease protein
MARVTPGTSPAGTAPLPGEGRRNGDGSRGHGGRRPSSGDDSAYRPPVPLPDRVVAYVQKGVSGLGSSASASFDEFGALAALVLDTVWATGRALVRRNFSWKEFVEQAWFLASVSLLPTLLIALPFGLVLVLQVGSLANQIGAPSFVGAVDAVGTVREAAPIITAIVLAGAGGSAICADLGARTIRDEISAMQVMGLDEVERLVAPRLLATVMISILLNGIVSMAGIISGYLADVTVLHGAAGGFLNSFTTFAQPADIIESELKAAIFGVLAATVASHKGLGVSKGPSGVGEAVNQSVVVTGVALFVINLILTEIFLVLVPPPFI